MPDSLWPRGLEPARLLCPWIFQARILEWLPFPLPGDLPNPGIEPMSPALQEDSLPAEPSGKPKNPCNWHLNPRLSVKTIVETENTNWKHEQLVLAYFNGNSKYSTEFFFFKGGGNIKTVNGNIWINRSMWWT